MWQSLLPTLCFYKHVSVIGETRDIICRDMSWGSINMLALHMLVKNFSRQYFEIFVLFFLGNRTWDLMQIICNNLHEVSDLIFLGKVRKNVISLSSAAFAHSVVSVRNSPPVKFGVLRQNYWQLSYFSMKTYFVCRIRTVLVRQFW